MDWQETARRAGFFMVPYRHLRNTELSEYPGGMYLQSLLRQRFRQARKGGKVKKLFILTKFDCVSIQNMVFSNKKYYKLKGTNGILKHETG